MTEGSDKAGGATTAPPARHVVVLLHGVAIEPGDVAWSEKFEARYQSKTATPMEFIARSYAGIFLKETSALATWLPLYRYWVFRRERRFFEALRREVGPSAQISAIGHSFGGYILCEALRRGLKFHRLVLVAPAVDEHFDWRKVERQFDRVFVYYSNKDEVIPWAWKWRISNDAYGEMGYVGTRVYHNRVHSYRFPMRHSEYFKKSQFDWFAKQWISHLEE